MSAPRPACWCCGRDVDENVLLRLGAHPEAGVCPDCAQHLHRRATEHADRRRAFHTPGSLARTATRPAPPATKWSPAAGTNTPPSAHSSAPSTATYPDHPVARLTPLATRTATTTTDTRTCVRPARGRETRPAAPAD